MASSLFTHTAFRYQQTLNFICFQKNKILDESLDKDIVVKSLQILQKSYKKDSNVLIVDGQRWMQEQLCRFYYWSLAHEYQPRIFYFF